MGDALPGGKEASYRLLGLQALVHDNGVILKRGTTRLFLDGDDVVELVDLLVENLAGGRSVELSRLISEIGAGRRDALQAIVETLKAHRFLVGADGTASKVHTREDVFFWNYQTSFAEIVGELAQIQLTVFGVNSIGLALLGNLRGCGFRDIIFVDHPALRNSDYFDSKHRLRHEISGALSVPPIHFDDWNAGNANPQGCFVVCCDFGGRPLMRDWNRFCIENRVLFYPITLLDHVAHLGPIVVPDEGPCYECLWVRQNANFEDALRLRAGETEPDAGQHAIGYLQPMARAAADFAAIDLLKTFSTSLSGRRIGRIVEIDLLEPRTTCRNLLKTPNCPVCVQPRDDRSDIPPAETAEIGAAETVADMPDAEAETIAEQETDKAVKEDADAKAAIEGAS